MVLRESSQKVRDLVEGDKAHRDLLEEPFSLGKVNNRFLQTAFAPEVIVHFVDVEHYNVTAIKRPPDGKNIISIVVEAPQNQLS
jgi:hypothetical protein